MKKIPNIRVGDLSNCIILLGYPHLKSLEWWTKTSSRPDSHPQQSDILDSGVMQNMCHDKLNIKTYTGDKILS